MNTNILQSLFCKYYVFGNFGSNKNQKNIKSCAGILVYFVLFKLQLIRTSLKRRMYSICHDCNPLYGYCSIETSDNEANLHLFSGVKNITGNAESAEYSYLIGTHGTRKAEARYIIPLVQYKQVYLRRN